MKTFFIIFLIFPRKIRKKSKKTSFFKRLTVTFGKSKIKRRSDLYIDRVAVNQFDMVSGMLGNGSVIGKFRHKIGFISDFQFVGRKDLRCLNNPQRLTIQDTAAIFGKLSHHIDLFHNGNHSATIFECRIEGGYTPDESPERLQDEIN